MTCKFCQEEPEDCICPSRNKPVRPEWIGVNPYPLFHGVNEQTQRDYKVYEDGADSAYEDLMEQVEKYLGKILCEQMKAHLEAQDGK